MSTLIVAKPVPHDRAKDAQHRMIMADINTHVVRDGITSIQCVCLDERADEVEELMKKCLAYDLNNWQFKHTTFERKIF